jgi:hypothetical protein
MRKEFEAVQANPVKVYPAVEAEVWNRFGNKMFLGYAFSFAGGAGLARWLAKRHTSGYRPGVIGQLSLTMLITFFGGAANAQRIAPAFFEELVKTPNTQSGRMLCSGVLQMGPCINDADCKRFMSFGPGKHFAQWYEVSLSTNISPSRNWQVNVRCLALCSCLLHDSCICSHAVHSRAGVLVAMRSAH